MCLLRAEVANPDLPKALEELGAIVDDIAIYKTVAETEDPAGAGARAARKRRGLGDVHERLDGGTFSRAV
jgi:uroporphyrinogen-III synthase